MILAAGNSSGIKHIQIESCLPRLPSRRPASDSGSLTIQRPLPSKESRERIGSPCGMTVPERALSVNDHSESDEKGGTSEVSQIGEPILQVVEID